MVFAVWSFSKRRTSLVWVNCYLWSLSHNKWFFSFSLFSKILIAPFGKQLKIHFYCPVKHSAPQTTNWFRIQFIIAMCIIGCYPIKNNYFYWMFQKTFAMFLFVDFRFLDILVSRPWEITPNPRQTFFRSITSTETMDLILCTFTLDIHSALNIRFHLRHSLFNRI